MPDGRFDQPVRWAAVEVERHLGSLVGRQGGQERVGGAHDPGCRSASRGRGGLIRRCCRTRESTGDERERDAETEPRGEGGFHAGSVAPPAGSCKSLRLCRLTTPARLAAAILRLGVWMFSAQRPAPSAQRPAPSAQRRVSNVELRAALSESHASELARDLFRRRELLLAVADERVVDAARGVDQEERRPARCSRHRARRRCQTPYAFSTSRDSSTRMLKGSPVSSM